MKIGPIITRTRDAFRLMTGRAKLAAPADAQRGQPGPFTIRRFEAAETNRLNRAHWQNATGQPINTDLLADLETLRARAAYEAANNGTVDGVIATHSEDVVGRDGPTLQVESEDAAWNEAAERVWRDWFYSPCPNPKFSGTQLLKLWIRTLWTCGEFVAQIVTDPSADGPVSLRLRPIHPRRLKTPFDRTGDPDVCMGIRFNLAGVPQQYFIEDPLPVDGMKPPTGAYTAIPPDLIVHEFLVREEDQARGYPWLSSALQPVADLRDYDDSTLDACRQATDTGITWYTEHPNATYIEVNESTEIQRRQQWTGPPGWKPMQIKPEHPTTNYVEYRREKQAEIGRSVSMPLMTIRLDSSNHNYSSARFDGQNYHRAVQGLQYWLSGTPRAYGCLSRLFWEVIGEARFSVPALRTKPKSVALHWQWNVPPHVDPQREAAAERTRMENGTLPFAAACAAAGTDEEAVFAAEARTNERRAARGLPPLPPPGTYLRVSNPTGADAATAAEDAAALEQQQEELANATP